MPGEVNVVIHFKDLENDEVVRDHIRMRFEHLAAEFPEAMHFEITIEPGVNAIDAHGHVSGKRTRVAAHAHGAERPRQAADAVIEKLERELRTEHDKRIFTQRRKAQKKNVKRGV